MDSLLRPSRRRYRMTREGKGGKCREGAVDTSDGGPDDSRRVRRKRKKERERYTVRLQNKYDERRKVQRLTLSEGMVRTVVIVTGGQEASCRE